MTARRNPDRRGLPGISVSAGTKQAVKRVAGERGVAQSKIIEDSINADPAFRDFVPPVNYDNVAVSGPDTRAPWPRAAGRARARRGGR